MESRAPPSSGITVRGAGRGAACKPGHQGLSGDLSRAPPGPGGRGGPCSGCRPRAGAAAGLGPATGARGGIGRRGGAEPL